ncbi:protein-glutamine gamma-glutamyltransferase 5-like [Seriola lalandi dorsalis]|uniref:protein-glutamine gamma-glutamyltransferase 5-like n=2 Tax=Seriola lalandi dorsalis TaxID=1841481 RepID=UPI000C6FAEF2|nr:protein-glutamine gamma-glutamyltransferase 5-like [Seriola lalandi dorsalis]
MSLSVLKTVDLHSQTNNTEHHTSEISVDQLIVRRGQPFTVTLHLTQAFNHDLHHLNFTAETGELPSEDRGTKSRFAIPDNVWRSSSAKAVWRVELKKNYPQTAIALTITPPSDTPIGEYKLSVSTKHGETLRVTLTVLFNPWCPDDWVFLPDERERQEYVMNEQGIIYRGSGRYISPCYWDYAQFEDDMVKICMKMLDMNRKHLWDPADDVSARCNPIYVGRVVSAMINCADDRGVLQGNWSGSFGGGVPPTHWSGSHAILKRWYNSNCRPVRYGQCWVFAGVMCSVCFCRLQVPNNKWVPAENRNFHVWVEGWMRRPDLSADGKFDGWQILDPTPQEKSDGVYCCGPAPLTAIKNGHINSKYDLPFVFAEVNADCVDWLVKADGSKVKIYSDTKRVGHNISTKSVGSNQRQDVTNNYKYREGSKEEREAFKYATTGDLSGDFSRDLIMHSSAVSPSDSPTNVTPPTSNGGNHVVEETDEENLDIILPLPVSMRFEEVSQPVNGKDVSLNLVLTSKSGDARPLSVNLSVQAMRYNGRPAVNIKTEVKEATLQPGKDLSIPVLVPFSSYHKHMVQLDSLKISAIVTDKQNPDIKYLAEDDVVLLDPPISVTVSTKKLYSPVISPVLTCTHLSSHLYSPVLTCHLICTHLLPDLQRNRRIRIQFPFVPYKTGEKTLMVDFNCSAFRNLKTSGTVTVRAEESGVGPKEQDGNVSVTGGHRRVQEPVVFQTFPPSVPQRGGGLNPLCRSLRPGSR